MEDDGSQAAEITACYRLRNKPTSLSPASTSNSYIYAFHIYTGEYQVPEASHQTLLGITFCHTLWTVQQPGQAHRPEHTLVEPDLVMVMKALMAEVQQHINAPEGEDIMRDGLDAIVQVGCCMQKRRWDG